MTTVGAVACRVCGSAQSAERCPGSTFLWAVVCSTCTSHYLTNNPAIAFYDLSVPKEPQKRVKS